LFLWPDAAAGLKVAAEDPVKCRSARFIPVGPADALDSVYFDQRDFIWEQAKRQVLAPYRRQLEAFFSTVTCPKCEEPFCLIAHLEGDDDDA
jgi:hypothetical protein